QDSRDQRAQLLPHLSGSAFCCGRSGGGLTIDLSAPSYLIAIALFLVLSFVIFLVTRWFWCWYFKINELVNLLKSIDASLRQLPAVAKARNPA
ncbi:MAG TPA: hypothetical protein VNF49_02680, partial [Candidatus Binataceae bacterium]|nr:hypothetical protein [Candidatus Binataceae bacterium]